MCKEQVHVVEFSASAGDREMNATIDGPEYWWYGSDQNFINLLIEKEIERIFEERYRIALIEGIDVEAGWIAKVHHTVHVLQTEEEVR